MGHAASIGTGALGRKRGQPASRLCLAASRRHICNIRLPANAARNKGLSISARAERSIIAPRRLPFEILPCKCLLPRHDGSAVYEWYGSKESVLHTVSSYADAKALEEREVGVSDWVVVDQERIDRFADATGDYQWIHVDTERAARELPDGKTIAHGYLTMSLIPTLTADFVRFENLSQTINFGCNKLRFYTPVSAGSRVRARAVVKQVRQRAGALHIISEVRIEVEGERKPACVAETIGLYFLRNGD